MTTPTELTEAREHVRNAVRCNIKALDRLTELPDYDAQRVMSLNEAIRGLLWSLTETAKVTAPSAQGNPTP